MASDLVMSKIKPEKHLPEPQDSRNFGLAHILKCWEFGGHKEWGPSVSPIIGCPIYLIYLAVSEWCPLL
jgi:hypothetical protein